MINLKKEKSRKMSNIGWDLPEVQSAAGESKTKLVPSAQEPVVKSTTTKLFIGLGLHSEISVTELRERIEEVVPLQAIQQLEMSGRATAFLTLGTTGSGAKTRSSASHAQKLIAALNNTYVKSTRLNVQLDQRGGGGAPPQVDRFSNDRPWEDRGRGRGSFSGRGGPRGGGIRC